MIWLPYANLTHNVKVLTLDHLEDVIYEGVQCLRDVQNNSPGRNFYMWRNRPAGLMAYVVQAEVELRERGEQPDQFVIKAFTRFSRSGHQLSPVMPIWFGEPNFHLAQRSHLIRVDPVHYARRLPLTTPLNLPLVWPKEKKIK